MGLFNVIMRTSIEPLVVIYIAKTSPSLEKRRGKKIPYSESTTKEKGTVSFHYG